MKNRCLQTASMPAVFVQIAALCLTMIWITPADAAMFLHIEKITPRMGQRGTTVEVIIQGACLNDPREIVFYRPGIRALRVESMPKLAHPIGLAHGGRIEDQVRCQFQIAPDCAPGEYPFRMRTATEITSIGTFHVSPFPVVDENEKGNNSNDTIQTAMAIVPNVTVRGRMGPSGRGDIDMFRVPVVAGQRLAVEVDSVRIADVHYGGSEYDLAVRVLDETGKELASNDDNSLHLQDPMAAVKLPRDGYAYVEVKRSIFVPDDREYCLHIGTNRRPLAAYPPGAQAGTTQKFRFMGDPLGDFTETVTVPSQTGTFDYYGDAPSPLSMRSSPYPNILEDTDAVVNRVGQLPVALNGIINTREDTDTFGLSVKKGDRLRIRVFAATLGSPIDPVLRLRPVAVDGNPGPVEWEADDSALPDRDIFGTLFRSRGGLKDILDPSVVWEPKADGDYLLEILDSSGSGGPSAVYRIEVEQAPDSVHTFLASTAFDWMECIRTSGLAVPRGNRWTVNVNVQQGQGNSYRGDLNLVAHGLPAGVRMVSSRIPAGRTFWPVQLVADDSAQPGSALITFEAKPVDTTRKFESRSQQHIPFINHSGGDAWRTVKLDRYVLAITDPAPFSIDIQPPPVPLVRGGELAIPVKIKRRPGFNEAIEFQCDWIPAGVGIQPALVIPAGATEAVLKVSGEANAPLGQCPLVVVASTIREGLDAYLGTGRVRVSSEIVNLVIAEPFVELSSAPESVRRGAHQRYVWKVQHKSPFEGTAQVKLLGLPKGVNVVAPLPVLSKDSREIAFDIEATDEALLGSARGVSCEVIVQAGGQEIRQRTGSGTLRIDPK
jgi:hypothetical protein